MINKNSLFYQELDVEECTRMYNVCKANLHSNAGGCPLEVIIDQLDPSKGMNDVYMATYDDSLLVSLTAFKEHNGVLAVWCFLVGNDQQGSRRWCIQGTDLSGYLDNENNGGATDVRRVAREQGYANGGIYFDKRGQIYKDYILGQEDQIQIKEIIDIDANTILVVLH